jgi:hypothetical protein
MGVFSKKKKKEADIPRLPSLPELPDLPNFENHPEKKELSKLPSFPSSMTGDKFSQDSIKGAVDEPEDDEEEMMSLAMPQPPQNKSITPERIAPMQKPVVLEKDPIFIRIDKFEESLKIFTKTKEKISEIEELLKHTKELKEKETQELNSWEMDVQQIKTQIEKVDKEIFSKV